MAVINIVYHPNPLLKQTSKEVTEFNEELSIFLDNMVETMNKNDGGGLAAVQVGVLKRILIVDAECWGAKDIGMLRIINPKIIWSSEETGIVEEGCLSYPGIRVSVSRPEQIEIEYQNEKGEVQTLKAEGDLARCIQHEIDHLDGKTLADRIPTLQKAFMLSKVKRNVAKKVKEIA